MWSTGKMASCRTPSPSFVNITQFVYIDPLFYARWSRGPAPAASAEPGQEAWRAAVEHRRHPMARTGWPTAEGRPVYAPQPLKHHWTEGGHAILAGSALPGMGLPDWRMYDETTSAARALAIRPAQGGLGTQRNTCSGLVAGHRRGNLVFTAPRRYFQGLRREERVGRSCKIPDRRGIVSATDQYLEQTASAPVGDYSYGSGAVPLWGGDG